MLTMITDDRFQRRLRDLAARYLDWARGLAGVGEIKVEDAGGYWRFAAMPDPANSCPFEILVHPGDKVDLFIADQVYEERSLDPLERLLPLTAAIADGQVITRHWLSAATGLLLRVETIIAMADDTVWRDGHDLAPDNIPATTPHWLKRDRHYVPYKR